MAKGYGLGIQKTKKKCVNGRDVAVLRLIKSTVERGNKGELRGEHETLTVLADDLS
ncbi:MAG: hypothetical protein HY537_18730 [Deltaproteobacteria bacterium]|nr:hypothetical protein [Deltaproteobacteria bacterium]